MSQANAPWRSSRTPLSVITPLTLRETENVSESLILWAETRITLRMIDRSLNSAARFNSTSQMTTGHSVHWPRLSLRPPPLSRWLPPLFGFPRSDAAGRHQ